MGAFSIGGGGGKTTSSLTQDVWDPQASGLAAMYDAAGNLITDQAAYTDQAASMVPGVTDQMGDVYNLGMGGMETLASGGSVQDPNQIMNMLMSMMNGGPTNTSMMYESIVGGPGNTYIDPMVDAMKTSMMQNRDTMQAQNALGANSMGQGGSSRHAMENAMTNKQINQDMNAAEMAMRGGAYDTDLAMKLNIAGLADSNKQADMDRMMDMLGMYDTNVATGVDAGSEVQDLGMGQFDPMMMAQMMPWLNMDFMASVMGDPTVLTDQTAKSKSGSGGFSIG